MVTLEHLLEQIFGDLQDEFDPVIPAFRLVAGDQIWIRGDVNLSVVNEILSMNIPEDDADTIGGLVMNVIGHLPVINDEIEIQGIRLRVEKMAGRGIIFISITGNKDQIKRIQEMSI